MEEKMSQLKKLRKIQKLFKMVGSDAEYRMLAVKYEQLESAFGELMQKLTIEEQNIAWGFVCVSEDMNWRMLEWLCEQYQIDP